ncbi:hypothetical protein ACFZB9_22705 [Kitasatospora sp. NPDC008050]|uniref:hypothetical protein n=1 Tax=Kitasatospora sp. NPDC008050 TaxID=3364021 RepID=UPI0036ED6C13
MANHLRIITAFALTGTLTLAAAGTADAAPSKTESTCAEKYFDGSSGKWTRGDLCLRENGHDMWITLRGECKPGALSAYRACTSRSVHYALKKDGDEIGHFSLGERLQYPGPGKYEVSADVYLDGSWYESGEGRYGVHTSGPMSLEAPFTTPTDPERLRANISDPKVYRDANGRERATYTLTITNDYPTDRTAGIMLARSYYSLGIDSPSGGCTEIPGNKISDMYCRLGSIPQGSSRSITVSTGKGPFTCDSAPFSWSGYLQDSQSHIAKDVTGPTPWCPKP